MILLNNKVGRTIKIDEKEFLFFSGYDYLGIQNNIEFESLINEGIKKYGWLFPSSRISNTQLALFDEFERMLSDKTNTLKTISFTAGFTAGTVAASIFKKSHHFIYPNAHPAVNKSLQAKTSFENWFEKTIDTINTSNFLEKPVLICDAVNPLTATIYDFSLLEKIEKEIVVIIDDSHGFGIIGKNGNGITDKIPKKNNIEYLLVYSLSKGFSINAGAISCTNLTTANSIKGLPEFTSSTAVSPALIFAFLHGQTIYANNLEKLKSNIDFVSQKIRTKTSAFINPELPMIILGKDYNEDVFFNNEIIISSFSYPTTIGEKINRAVINALHTHEDLEVLLSFL